MGSARPKPERLAEKLLAIRNAFGISQSEMVRRLGVEDKIWYTQISSYETGRNEPSLMILLRYARVAGVHMEDIVDDELDLPDKLPGPVNYKGLKPSARRKSKKQ